MRDLVLPLPPVGVIRMMVAAVWLYEGLWCKLLARAPMQGRIVEAVPRVGQVVGRVFLKILGVMEAAIAVWVLTGVAGGACAITQAVFLVMLNTFGLLWARQLIHDPAGMVIKNGAFLMLAWICGALSGG